MNLLDKHRPFRASLPHGGDVYSIKSNDIDKYGSSRSLFTGNFTHEELKEMVRLLNQNNTEGKDVDQI